MRKKSLFYFILIILFIIFGYFGVLNFNNSRTQNTKNIFQKGENKNQEIESFKKYTNSKLGIEFNYPQSFNPNLENNEFIGDQPSRFVSDENNGAFKSEIFLNLAETAEDNSIDQITESSAYHKLKPFGENPVIEKLQIQDQEIRVIKSTEGQNKEREIIIELKKTVQLNNYYWKFLVIHLTGPLSDKTLEIILSSLKFI